MRQGDPSLPLLFNLAANGLAVLIKKKVQVEGLLTGLIPHLVERGVVCLQYVDDMFFLVQDDLEMAKILKLILILFSKCLV